MTPREDRVNQREEGVNSAAECVDRKEEAVHRKEPNLMQAVVAPSLRQRSSVSVGFRVVQSVSINNK